MIISIESKDKKLRQIVKEAIFFKVTECWGFENEIEIEDKLILEVKEWLN